MPFQPLVNDVLQIDETLYRITEHPTAPGLPYGQEGRQATVYQLIADPAANAAGPADRRAIKAFKPRFRSPALVVLSERLAAFADLPGLAVCRRQVLTPSRHRALLATHPDLIYSVVMPWIDGPTWFEIVADRRPLTPAQALGLARSLTSILCQMEQRGLAHCDLSGSNIILPGLIEGRPADAGEAVALVDVESMFGPGLDQPVATTSGSPGYQLPTGDPSAWNATADRFAGAILLTEMLGWCDERARSAAWGESYFEPNEHQRETEQYRLMTTVLTERWGPGVARLLDRAWQSTVQSECPTFGEWQMALPDTAPAAPSPRPAAGWSAAAAVGAAVAQPPPVANAADDTAARTLYDLGRQREAAGDREMARTLYQQALALAPVGGALALELNAALAAATAAPVPPGGESAMPPTNAQPTPDAAPPTRPTTPDPEIEMLFDDALVAYGAQDLDRTRQLLRDVLRRQPNYARDGQTAQALLTEVEQRLAPAGAAKAGAAGAVVGAAGAATGAAGQTSAPVSPTPRPGGKPATGRIASWALAAAILIATLFGAAWLLRGSLGWGDSPQPTITTASVPTATAPTIASAATAVATLAAQAATPAVAAKPTAPPAASTSAPSAATPTPAPAATTAASSAPTPSVAPAVTAAGKLVILYSSHRPEIHDSQIWSMGVDGSNPQSFTATRGHSWAPRVSPDGQRFFFSSVAPGEHVSHDPTGGGTSKNPGNHDIYVSSADASDIQNVTARFNAWDNAWSWSPDGKWIAFSSDRDGNWEIYKMTITGENITRLTNHPSSDGWPSWSPDGKSIVFASDRSGNWEVFSMSDDGANPRQLTERKEAYNTFPMVSPDGKKIVFSSQLPERKEGEIYLMNLDGTGLTRLTRGSVSLNNMPTFCPDGRIAFVSDRSGNDDIWIMNGDGSNPVQLTTQRGEDTTPSCGYLRGA